MTSYRIRFSAARLQFGALIVAICAFALLPAATATAADPTDEQYQPSLEQLSTGGQGGDPSGGSATVTDGLPFTGLDVALLAAVAGGLLLAGLVLRRQRPNESVRS